MEDLGHAIGQERRRDGDETVAGLGELGLGGYLEGDPSEQLADQPAAADTGKGLPIKSRVRYKGEWSVLVEIPPGSSKQ